MIVTEPNYRSPSFAAVDLMQSHQQTATLVKTGIRKSFVFAWKDNDGGQTQNGVLIAVLNDDPKANENSVTKVGGGLNYIFRDNTMHFLSAGEARLLWDYLVSIQFTVSPIKTGHFTVKPLEFTRRSALGFGTVKVQPTYATQA